MSERNFDFDRMLEDSLPEIPPDEITRSVNPWKKSMRRILIGFAMSTITLHFWGLQYILPMIGILLSFLGFRMLRSENGWFRACYILSLVRLLYFGTACVLDASIFRGLFLMDTVKMAMGVMISLGVLILYFCFWRGLCRMQERAGFSDGVSGGFWMVVWYFVVGVLALLESGGTVFSILLMICYVLIIRSEFCIMRELDEAGYTVRTAPIHISDGLLSAIVLGFFAVGTLCSLLLFHSYPMEWKPRELHEKAEVEEIKGHLESLGFPDYVLEDLTDEDVLACAGATEVVVDTRDWAMNDGRLMREILGDTISINRVYDVEELRVTGVGVKLSDDKETWKFFHHFVWIETPRFFGTESIKIWSQTSDAWGSNGVYSGQLLYDKDGVTYVSPYYSLGEETYTQNSIFWGERTSTDVFAEFSLPENGEYQRGYLSYCLTELRSGSLIDSWIDYTHQQSPWQYPFLTAKEEHQGGMGMTSEAFKTIQDALQFYPYSTE